jgi:hypothetical protein
MSAPDPSSELVALQQETSRVSATIIAVDGDMGVELEHPQVERDPAADAAYQKRPSIMEMVSHLRDSMVEIQSRLGASGVHADELPSRKDAADSQPAQPATDARRFGLQDSFKTAMVNAVAQLLNANRFAVVRDSLTGQQPDESLHPPPRPFADEKNILSVRPGTKTSYLRRECRCRHECRSSKCREPDCARTACTCSIVQCDLVPPGQRLTKLQRRSECAVASPGAKRG